MKIGHTVVMTLILTVFLFWVEAGHVQEGVAAVSGTPLAAGAIATPAKATDNSQKSRFASAKAHPWFKAKVAGLVMTPGLAVSG